jgi:hypothetical protein
LLVIFSGGFITTFPDISAFNQVGSSFSPYILDILNQYGLPAPEVNRPGSIGPPRTGTLPKT